MRIRRPRQTKQKPKLEKETEWEIVEGQMPRLT